MKRIILLFTLITQTASLYPMSALFSCCKQRKKTQEISTISKSELSQEANTFLRQILEHNRPHDEYKLSDAVLHKVVEYLITELGADPNTGSPCMEDHKGEESYIVDALEIQRPLTAQVLINHGAHLCIKSLYVAVHTGDISTLTLILQKARNINLHTKVDGHGNNILAHVPINRIDIFQLLTEHGLNPHHKNKSGETLLHNIASKSSYNKHHHNYNHEDVKNYCLFLISQAIDPKIKNTNGETAYDIFPQFEFLKPDETK